MDFDPRDHDTRDEERFNGPHRGGKGHSSDRDRDDDLRLPGIRPRDREDHARELGRGPGDSAAAEHNRDPSDARWPERERDGRERDFDPRDVFTRGINLPRGLEREIVRDRDRDYTLRGSESRTLATVGAFRVVSSRDLRDHHDRPADLESGELDFLVAPEGYVSANHPTDVLFEDTYTCVAWSGNESIGTSLTIDQYLDLGHVVVNVAGGEQPGNYDEQFLRRANFKRRAEISVPTFSLAPQLVVGTGRVATITTRLAVKYARTLPLKLVPMPISIPPMVEILQWHKVHDYDPANQWFRRLLREAVGDLPHGPALTADVGRSSEAPPTSRARPRERRR